MHRTPKRRFSLIELMVVVAIMALLASLVAVNLSNQQISTYRKIALTDMTGIVQSCELYRLDMGHLPSSMTDLWQRPANSRRWGPKPYVDPHPPLDPWGNEYVYSRENGSVELTSYGADGQPGGTDENTDLKFSELRSRAGR